MEGLMSILAVIFFLLTIFLAIDRDTNKKK